MTEHRPIWQDGGIHEPLPPDSMIRAWEHKMDPWLFDLNGRVRRAYRTTYGQRLGRDVTVLLGVVAFCAVVWWAVWGVMAA